MHPNQKLRGSSSRNKSQDEGEKGMEKDRMDLDAIIEELDNEFDGEVVEQLEETPLEEGDDTAVEGDIEEDETLDEQEEENLDNPEDDSEEPEETVNDEDVHKRNNAFKVLREERDNLAASEKFLQEMAADYGLTKDQLIERFRADQAKKDAEKQGLSPEQFAKIQGMETRLKEVEESKSREIFNIKAEQLASKYSLKNNDMVNLFKEATKMKLDVTANPELLEFVYRSLNYDKAINQGRQDQIATTKKRRKTSTGATGTVGSKVTVSEEKKWDKEIDALIEGLNL